MNANPVRVTSQGDWKKERTGLRVLIIDKDSLYRLKSRHHIYVSTFLQSI